MAIKQRNIQKNSKQTSTPKQSNVVYSWSEVEKHNTGDNCWIVYKDGVYDVTEFVPKHPGGKFTLSTAAGQDITYLMQTSHIMNDYPFDILKKYKIGTIEHNFVTYTNEQPFYDEIKDKVRNYFKKTKLDPKDGTFTFYVFFGILFFIY